MNKPFYDIKSVSPGEAWDIVNNTGLRNHYICSVLATRMMIEHQKKKATSPVQPGLIVNITSVGGKVYLFNVAYGSGKAALDRITHDMALELKRENINISIVGLSPGLVRTEHLLNAASKSPGKFNMELLTNRFTKCEIKCFLMKENYNRLSNRKITFGNSYKFFQWRNFLFRLSFMMIILFSLFYCIIFKSTIWLKNNDINLSRTIIF
uniref:Dehydrogenase/reductase SDR family member 11 n=1 Tax=Schistosoma japonicum TaxID=6182 RepID=Q5DHU3_SCHJA|nr:unknown [Schistosoma japonicum]